MNFFFLKKEYRMAATEVKDYQVRNACFTINNYKPSDCDKLKELKCDYIVFGKEVGASGTPHLQGYIEFKGGKRFSTLKKMFPTMHIEPRKGTAKQASDYCKKDDPNFYENGEISNQGTRTDLTAIKDEIMSGSKSVLQIRQENPFFFHLYGRTLNTLEDDFNRTRRRHTATKGVWLWGPTGVGKSDIAYDYDRDTDETHYTYNIKEMYQNGYTGQKYTIMDDFRGDVKFRELLTLADKHNSVKFPIKGRDPIRFTSEYLIITSAKSPEEVFVNKLTGNDSIEQFYRRFKVFHLPEQRQEAAEYCQVTIPDEYATEVLGVILRPRTVAEILHKLASRRE